MLKLRFCLLVLLLLQTTTTTTTATKMVDENKHDDVDFRSQPHSLHRKPRSEQAPGSLEIVITQLSEQVTQLAATVTSLTNDVTVLRSQNGDLQQRADGLQSVNAALETKLNASEVKILRQDSDLQALSAKMSALEAKVQSVQDTSLTNVEDDVSAIHNDLKDLTQAHNSTAAKVNQHSSQIVALGGSMALVQNDIIVMKTDVTGIRSDVTAIHVTDNNINAELSAQTQRVDGLQQSLAVAVTRISRTEQDTQDLTRFRSEIVLDVGGMNATMTQLLNDVSGLQGKGQQLESTMKQVQQSMTQLEQKFASSAHRVMFYAKLTDELRVWDHQTVIPDHVITNVGGGYDPTTGNFTAPVSGDYFLSGAVLGKNPLVDHSPRVAYKVDGVTERIFLSDPDHPFLLLPVHLNAGQKVWIENYFSSTFGYGTYFSGFLYNADATTS